MEAATWSFGHLRLARLSPQATLEWVLERSTEERASVVVTSNVHHLRLAEIDLDFRDVATRAELNVADGWPLVLASRVLGEPLPGRVAGIDLVDSLLGSSIRLRVAILGGSPGAAEGLANQVGERQDVVLVDPLPRGSWQGSGLSRLRSALRAADPSLVLLGIGAPRQELLADSLRSSVSGPIVCCGAAIEVLAGLRPRAPLTVQRVGLEWAWRAALEPTRLAPRYARSGAWFLRILVRELGRAAAGRRERLSGR